MNKTQETDGFSIVELMIVIAIIAILVSIGFPFYRKYPTEAKATEAMSEPGHIRTTQILCRSIGKIISPNPDPGRVKKP